MLLWIYIIGCVITWIVAGVLLANYSRTAQLRIDVWDIVTAFVAGLTWFIVWPFVGICWALSWRET